MLVKHFSLNSYNWNLVSFPYEIFWVIWSNFLISWLMHVKKPREVGLSESGHELIIKLRLELTSLDSWQVFFSQDNLLPLRRANDWSLSWC